MSFHLCSFRGGEGLTYCWLIESCSNHSRLLRLEVHADGGGRGVLIQTVRNAHSHLLTQAESLHTNRGVMERAGHKTGEREREREMAGSKYTPANSSKMCLQMRKSSEPSNNSDTFFISSLRDASIQTIRKIKKKRKRWEPCHLSPEFFWFPFFPPVLYSSIHRHGLRGQGLLLLNASVTAGERRLRESIVKAMAAYCFSAFTALPFFIFLRLSLTSGLCPGGGRKLLEFVKEGSGPIFIAHCFDKQLSNAVHEIRKYTQSGEFWGRARGWSLEVVCSA